MHIKQSSLVRILPSTLLHILLSCNPLLPTLVSLYSFFFRFICQNLGIQITQHSFIIDPSLAEASLVLGRVQRIEIRTRGTPWRLFPLPLTISNNHGVNHLPHCPGLFIVSSSRTTLRWRRHGTFSSRLIGHLASLYP